MIASGFRSRTIMSLQLDELLTSSLASNGMPFGVAIVCGQVTSILLLAKRQAILPATFFVNLRTQPELQTRYFVLNASMPEPNSSALSKCAMICSMQSQGQPRAWAVINVSSAMG